MITTLDTTRYLSFGQFIQLLLEKYNLKQGMVTEKAPIDSGTLSRICTDHIPKQRKTRMDAALRAAENLSTYLQQAGIPKEALGNLRLFQLWYALVEHPFKFIGLVVEEESLDPDASKVLAALSYYPKGSPQRAALAEALVGMCESLKPILNPE
jgi:hypothetical protein